MKATSTKHFAFPLLLLLLLVVAGYWQVAFLQDSLKWDNSDAYHPYRFHVVECLRNGEFPWWNPFQFLGYPIHSDPQSGAWYPVLWLLSCFGPYSAAMMNVEFNLHLVIAVWGMFFLCRTLGSNTLVGFIGAVLYMFCGFTIETAQMLPFTVSMAWLPVVLAFAFRCFNDQGYGNAAGLGVGMALLLTGGYPAFSIILFYVLLGGGSVWFAKRLMAGEYALCLNLTYRIAAAVGFCLLISGGYLHALYEAIPYFSRGGGLEYNETFYSYALLRSDLVGLLMPLAEKAAEGVEGNGLLYSYFGCYALLLLLVAIGIKKTGFQWLVFFASWFCFAAAMGDELPVRKWLYDVVPGMQLFRHPIIFLGFAQLGWIITICYAVNELLNRVETNKRWWLVASVAVVLVLAVLLLDWDSFFPTTSLSDALNVVVFGDQFLSIRSKLAIQSTVLLGATLLFGIVVWKGNKKHITMALIAVLYLDGFMAVQLNRNLKITDEIKRATLDTALADLPDGFPLPNLELNLNTINDGMLNFSIPGKWKNLNTYAKQTAYDGYSPFILSNYDAFRKQSNYPDNLSHPLVYFSENGEPENRLPTPIQITNFGPNHIDLRVTNEKEGWITYFQNPFPGWKVLIDGEPATVCSAGLIGLTSKLTAGTHQVRFFFSDDRSTWFFFISMMAIFMAVLLALKELLSFRWALWVVLLPLTVAAFCRLFFPEPNRGEHLKKLAMEINNWPQIDSAMLVINTDEPEKQRYFNSRNSRTIRFREASLYNYPSLIEVVKETKSPYFIYVRDHLFDPLEVQPIVQSYFPTCLKTIANNKTTAYLFSKQGPKVPKDSSWSMNFDAEHPMWNFKSYLQDTNRFYSPPASYFMDSLADFSPTFSLHLNEKNYTNRVDISVKVKANSLPDSVQLVFLVKHPNGNHHSKSLHFSEMVKDTTNWHTVYWSIDISTIAKPNDVIKCFVWKLDKSSLNLDDYCIYPSKATHARHELLP